MADGNHSPIKHVSEEQSSTKAPIVMEMVEAIIDNNFDANEQTLNRVTPADDVESDLQATPRLRAAAPLSSASQLPPESQSGKLQRKGEGEGKTRSDNHRVTLAELGMAPSPSIEVQKGAKINRQLKRRRKFLIGDLSCMKADFVPAPRIANANIKYIR